MNHGGKSSLARPKFLECNESVMSTDEIRPTTQLNRLKLKLTNDLFISIDYVKKWTDCSWIETRKKERKKESEKDGQPVGNR